MVDGSFSGGSPGSDLLVGEIRGIRTFRVDDSGWLLPLYSGAGYWYDGPNTAICSPPTGERRMAHTVPADDCECGFYAYGTRSAATKSRATRHVQAVVSCWGGVVAGTQGFRAEHARIDAIWLAPNAPRHIRLRVAARYPSARMFTSVEAMTAEFPSTPLRCYGPDTTHPWRSRTLTALVLALVLVLGLAPRSSLQAHHSLLLGWLAVTAAFAALALWFAGTGVSGTGRIGRLSGAAITLAVLAWLVAPWAGLAGWLLRLPVLRAALVAGGGYLLALLPRHFPVERTPAARTFRGVRA